MQQEICNYYNKIAKTYDASRFSTTYGKFVHQQELAILNKYLSQKNIKNNLDLACGTGRFLQFADYGLDISQEMLQISKNTFPNKHIIKGEATSMPFENSFFNNIISFHLFMHLDITEFEKIVKETYRVAKKDAYFVFDIPSKKRRNLTSYKATSWHGGNQIKVSTLKKIIASEWNLVAYYGIAFFPIHRIPKSLRKYFIKLDSFLCKSIFKEYSSHLVFVLQKK